MPTEYPRALLEVRYYQAAQDYLRKLPLEHFMEATTQATQRKITMESLDLLQRRRPEIHVFSELLVQYPLPNRKRPGQVVPDNMVVIHDKPIKAEGSYDVPLQPVGPFWMLEYVSKNNRRKDYDDNMRKYEHELKVPYYMLFVPDLKELTLYRHTGERYVSVAPDEEGRYAIAELELEIGLQDGWVRYRYQRKLLALPVDLEQALEETQRNLVSMTRRAEKETQGRLTAEREVAELRAQIQALQAQKKNGA